MKTPRLSVDVPEFHFCTIYNVHSNSPFQNPSVSIQFICEITILIHLVLAGPRWSLCVWCEVLWCPIILPAVVTGQAPRPLSRLAIDNTNRLVFRL